MSTDDPRPSSLTIEQVAEDLSLSNMEGTSWFLYRHDEGEDYLLADLYDETGNITRTFEVRISVKEQ